MKALALIVVLLSVGVQEFTTPRVNIVYTGPEARLARSLAVKAGEALFRLEEEFGLPPKGRISIVLASSLEDFSQAQPGGVRVPVWAAGVAYPNLNLIVLKSGKAAKGTGLDKTLVHELTHVVLGRIFGRRPVPTWLNEGLTMHLADDWGVSRQVAMARAVSSGRLIPLRRLVDRFPEDRLSAETAYAQSYYFISFLRDRYGPQVVGRLVRNLGLGVSADNVLLQASGLRRDDLEEEFYRWLSGRFSLFWILTGPGVVWFLAAVLIVAAWAVQRRAGARKIAKWEAEADGPEADSVRAGGPGREDGTKSPL